VVAVSASQPGADAYPGGQAEHGGQLVAAEPLPQALRGGDHQAEQLPLRIAASVHRRPAGGQQHRQGLPVPGRAGGAELGPRQRLTSGASGIQRVGLGAVTALSALGAVQLHHQLTAAGQHPGQPGAVPAGALDGPGPQPGMLVGEIHQGLVAIRGGWHRQLGQHAAGAGIDRRGAVTVHVGVDPDDDLGEILQTGHAFISFARRGRNRFPAQVETAGL
jgi:hypothetical protein